MRQDQEIKSIKIFKYSSNNSTRGGGINYPYSSLGNNDGKDRQ